MCLVNHIRPRSKVVASPAAYNISTERRAIEIGYFCPKSPKLVRGYPKELFRDGPRQPISNAIHRMIDDVRQHEVLVTSTLFDERGLAVLVRTGQAGRLVVVTAC